MPAARTFLLGGLIGESVVHLIRLALLCRRVLRCELRPSEQDAWMRLLYGWANPYALDALQEDR